MDTTVPSELLADQHQRIDAGVLGAVEGNGSSAALRDALELLRLHLYLEETILFPPLHETGLAMPIFVMQREHGQMWPALQKLAAACAADAAIETLAETARQLFQLLQIHNTKEEELLYTAADRLGDGSADGPLVDALRDARVPDDWACTMAPH